MARNPSMKEDLFTCADAEQSSMKGLVAPIVGEALIKDQDHCIDVFDTRLDPHLYW